MLLSGPFEKFVEASPVTVMMRGIIENLFHPEPGILGDTRLGTGGTLWIR